MPKLKKSTEGLPFFLAEVKSKTTATVALSGPTEASLRQYLAWAAKASGLEQKEVELRFMDRVISDAIKRDSNYRAAMKDPSKS